MQKLLDQLLSLLDVEELEVNIFRAHSPQEGSQRVFGGQVLGQALVAAGRSVDADESPAHSFHAYTSCARATRQRPSTRAGSSRVTVGSWRPWFRRG